MWRLILALAGLSVMFPGPAAAHSIASAAGSPRPEVAEASLLALLVIANAAYVAVLALAVLGLLSAPGNSLRSLFLVTTAYFLLLAILFVGDP